MRIKLLLTLLVFCIISTFLIIHVVPKIANTDTFTLETPQTNLPKGLKSRIGKGMIHDVAYLPDSTQFAVASATGIWFYDANTYEETALIATDKPAVKMMAFSSDSKKLATIGENKAILIWDTETLKHKTTFIYDSAPYHNFYFDYISFINDGQTLVSNGPGDIQFWNVTTGTHHVELDRLHGYSNFAFSPDGRIMATNRGNVILVRDVVEDKLLQKIEMISHVDKCLALSSDGRTVASGHHHYTSGNHHYTIDLWDIETGKHKKTLKGHKESIESLAFSPDGKTLASGSLDNTIILWDVAKGKRKKTLKKHANEIRKVMFSPDGKTLLSYDRSTILKLWEVETGKLIYSLRDHADIATSISLSPDGLTLVSGSQNGYILMWDVATGKNKKTFKAHKNSVTSVSYSPDGLTLASTSWDKPIHLWDVSTGKRKNSLKKPSGNMRNMVFSPVDPLLVVATDKSIHVWDVDQLQLKYEPIAHESNPIFHRLLLSADGKSIVSMGESLTVKIWNVAKGNLRKTLKLKDTWPLKKDIALNPDGKILASINSLENNLHLWNVVTGEYKNSLKDIHILNWFGIYLSCEFSPDGKYLVAGSVKSTLSTWDVVSGKLVKSLNGFSHRIRDIAFSQNGKTLVTSGDGTILVWDFATLINR